MIPGTYGWRRRESKPSENDAEVSRNAADRADDDSAAATNGCETRQQNAKPTNARAAFVAELAERVKILALAGDIEAARVASDALARLLGGSDGDSDAVVDLNKRRHSRGH